MEDGIRCMVMRGGSSKGAYFLREDLPVEPEARNALLQRIMGSPDSRQIDGIGGASSLTSKVAIVAPSETAEADIDYLFLQVAVDEDIVSDRQNCGNLLAGIAPFAFERGLLSSPQISTSNPDSTSDPNSTATVRIRMLNTGSVATATVPLRPDGSPMYEGQTSVSGVPGTAAAIKLDFEGLAGGSTGALLPTGRPVDLIDGVECTLIDNGMPVVVLAAEQVGIAGDESCESLEQNEALRATIESIRLKAGPMMNLGDVSETTVPKITMVSPPKEGGNITTRTFIPHRCHDAIGVLGAVSVATAAMLDGSPANRCATESTGEVLRLEHPTGFFDAVIEASSNPDGSVEVHRAGIVRTARKLMDGIVFPRPIPEGPTGL